MKNLRDHHLNVAHKVLRYVKGTWGSCLFYSCLFELKFNVYIISDSTGLFDTKKFIAGHCALFENSLVYLKSKKQQIVFISLTKVEYKAMANACYELTWIKYLLNSFWTSHLKATVRYYDKKVAMHIVTNLVFDERTNHIELDFHLIRKII